jgi:lipopolysaccharide export system protein LptA
MMASFLGKATLLLVSITLFLGVAGNAIADFEETESESEYESQKVPTPVRIEDPDFDDFEDEKPAETIPKEQDQKVEPVKKETKTPAVKKEKKPEQKKAKPASTKKAAKKNVAKPKQGASKNGLRKKPIKLRSEGLKGSRSDGKVLLKENVRIDQGDLQITCDEAAIYFDEGKEEIDRVVANGRVKLKKLDFTTKTKIAASARRVVYEQKKGLVTLTGNVSIYRGTDLIKGSRLVYDMNTGWITGKQVDGVVSPKSNEE